MSARSRYTRKDQPWPDPSVPRCRSAKHGWRRRCVRHYPERREPRCELALALVQSAQERTTAVELIAEIIVPRKDAVVGYPAQHGMADVRGPAILDVAADRIAAARIADQRHA